MKTPFDNPRGLMERLLYPTLKEVYTDGYKQAIEDRDAGRNAAWPPPPNSDEDDFEGTGTK